MMSKCAKFHADIPSRYRQKFIPARVIELSEMADFVFNFVQKKKKPVQAPNFDGRFDQLSLSIFLCGFHTRFLSTFSMP